MALLTVENLVTDLGNDEPRFRAVNGVSLSIQEGQTYCLVGESGSGKSVTALSIMGLLPEGKFHHPKGAVTLYPRQEHAESQELLSTSPEAMCHIRGHRIAMIFQEPMTSLNPVHSIGRQLEESLLLHQPHLSEQQRRQRIIDVLEDVLIPEPQQRMQQFPHNLSGGQRQRVMIAMALICEPDILIADEPTTALDVTVQAEILGLMRQLQQKYGMGMLFITHDFGVVAKIADTVGVMRRGELVESGPVATILGNPQHPYTQSLIAALPEKLPKLEKNSHTAHVDCSDKPNEPLLSAKNLSVHFPIRKGFMRRVVDQFRAVDEVSLDIHAGEIVALVGGSGCGKTTLGKALLRLQPLTTGSIILDGNDISAEAGTGISPVRRSMQMVFQDPGSSLNPRLPIYTTLVEPMRVHGIGNSYEDRAQRASDLLERVELPNDSLWRYPHEFSGGQRQRIAIARALVLQPRFILCDEVTSALDVSVQAGILKLLRQLADEDHIAMLFITHNMGVVDYLADRMLVMDRGKIIERGDTQQVLNAPEHTITQALLSAVPRLDASL